MGKARSVKEIQTYIPMDDEIELDDDLEMDRDEMLDDAMESASDAQKKTFNFVDAMSGSDEKGVGKVKIIKVMKDGQDNEICGTFPMDKFQDYDSMIEFIRLNYGGGEYRIHAKVPNESGRLVLRANKFIRIAREKMETSENKSNSLNENSALSEVLSVMRESQKDMREIIQKTQTEKKSMDLIEVLQTVGILTTALAPILTVYFANRPKQSNTISDFKAMLELTGQIKTVNNEDDDYDKPIDWMGMVGQFLNTFQQTNNGNVGLINSDVNSQNNTNAESSNNSKYALYAVFLNALVQIAPNEPDVNQLVGQLMMQLKPNEISILKQLLLQEKPLSFVTGYHPVLVFHIDWVNDLLGAFEEVLFTDVNNSGTSSPINNDKE